MKKKKLNKLKNKYITIFVLLNLLLIVISTMPIYFLLKDGVKNVFDEINAETTPKIKNVKED